jgi:hypothetical protein
MNVGFEILDIPKNQNVYFEKPGERSKNIIKRSLIPGFSKRTLIGTKVDSNTITIL